MELFWYNTKCTACGTVTEKRYSPSGRTYAEKFYDFATEMNRLAWKNNAKGWCTRCNICRMETVHVLNDQAPAYEGVE